MAIAHRGINTDLRDYYLSQIYKDYGAEKLRIALKAYMDFIIYYEEGHNNTTRKNRARYSSKSTVTF